MNKEKVLEWLEKFGPTTRATVQEELGVTPAQLHDWEIPGYLLLQASPESARTQGRRQFTDDVIADALRRAAQECGDGGLTIKKYSQWRADVREKNDEVVPSAPLITLRGSWREQCARAGVVPGVSPRGDSYERTWEREDVLQWVARFVDWSIENEQPATHARYEAWQRGVDDAPSGARVRGILQIGWSDIIAESAGY